MPQVKPWLLSAAAYTALALALCHGVVRHPLTTLPSDLGDPLLNTWILWWNAHATPLTDAWWDAPIFFPVKGALALSETLLGIAPITTPLQWIGVPIVATYNVAFIGSFVACALAAHRLVWRLTARHDAAFIAGLVYGFNPYRIAHGPHLQVLSSYWLPLALTGLHDYVETGRGRALALFAVSWLLQALVSGYFLLFSSVLLVVWLIWFAHATWRRAAAILAAWAVAAAACLPILLDYRRVQTALDLQRGINEIELFSADASALLASAGHLLVWGGRLIAPRPEGELFLGFTAAALVAAALWRAARPPIGRATVALLLGAAVPVTLGLVAFWFGGFALGPITVTRAFKPISVGVWLTIAAIVISVPLVTSLRSRSAFAFYVFATLVMFAFAFGPTPRVLGHRFWYQAPYRLLLELPGFHGVRVPARFGALAALTLAAAAGLAFDRLRPAAGSRRTLAMGAIVAGIALDSAAVVPAVRVPELVSVPEMQAAASVVELPIGDGGADLRAMFRAMAHGRPVVNGYSGYEPPHYHAATAGLMAGDPRTFDVFRSRGPVAVLVNDPDPAGGAWARALRDLGARQLAVESNTSIFWLDATTPPTAACAGGRAPIASIRASAGTDPRYALDGDRRTGWHSDALQSGGERIVLDLGALRTIDAITLVHGPFARDFPRGLRIDASADEERWTEIWSGGGASYTLAGALDDARLAPARIPVRSMAARFLALTQTGQASGAMWSIAEIEVCVR